MPSLKKIALFIPVSLISALVLFVIWTKVDPLRPIADIKAGEAKIASLPAMANDMGKRPNIVLIFIDDVGYGSMRPYKGLTVATPRTEELAAEGVTFTQGYVTAPVCGPSRAALMTGRYQQRFGIEYNPSEMGDRSLGAIGLFIGTIAADMGIRWRHGMDLPRTEVTLADALRKYGYKTGAFGKWHLGSDKDYWPTDRGFDTFFGFLTGVTSHANPDNPDVVTNFDHGPGWLKILKNRNATTGLYHDKTFADQGGYLSDRLTTEAVKFIEANKSEPFFLYFPQHLAHSPYQTPRSDYDAITDQPNDFDRVYYAMHRAADESIGKVLDTLDRLSLSDNTLVILASDNGAVSWAPKKSNGDLRGYKSTVFEGGIRIPFIMRYPGHIKPGMVDDAPVSMLDLFPTILQVASGHTLASELSLDGVSLWPWLRGERTDRPHQKLYWQISPRRAIRDGDWKYVEHADNALDPHPDIQPMLFDLAHDPDEQNNLIAAQPEIASRLKSELDAWSHEMPPLLFPQRPSAGKDE